MANASESTEKGDRGILARSKHTDIQAADAQAARGAGASDVKAAKALNKDAHNGSAGGDQNLSFELVDWRDGKSKVVVARKDDRLESISVEELIVKGRSGDKFAASIVQEMRAAKTLPDSQRQSVLTRLQDAADMIYGRTSNGESTKDDRIDTQAMKALAPSNEVARSALEMKEGIEKHLPPGQERDRLIAQLKADVTPVLKGKAEQEAYQEPNDWQAFLKLSPEQQRQIVESFERGSKEGQQEYAERIAAVARSVPKGYYNFGKSIYDCASGAGQFLFDVASDPGVGTNAWHSLSENMGQAFVGGIELSKIISAYAWTVGKDGNYSRPIEDLWKVTTIANDRWNATPMEVRTEKASELIAGMGAGAGIGGADKLARSGKLIDGLEEVAKATKGLTRAAKEKAAKALSRFFDDLMQPIGDTGTGLGVNIPREAAKNETAMLMSKADDLGGTGRLVNKGVDAAGKALKFSDESGIEVGELRHGPDKVWEQAPFPRGNDIHVVLGENLPAGTRTIDRVVFRDGIAEGQKSIDLTAESYAEPKKLESKLRDYVWDMKSYEGQKRLRMSFKMKEQEIEQKILHIGIRDGAMTVLQKTVFENIGRQIQEYNGKLPIGKAPLKLKVTVVK